MKLKYGDDMKHFLIGGRGGSSDSERKVPRFLGLHFKEVLGFLSTTLRVKMAYLHHLL